MSNNSNNSNKFLGDILGNYVDIDKEDVVNADYRTVDNYFDFKVFYNKHYDDNNNTKDLVVAHMRHTPLLYKGQIIPVDNGSLFQVSENIRDAINKGEYQLSFIRNTDGAELLFEFTYGAMFGVPLVYKLKLVNESYDSLSWFEEHTFDKIKKEYEILKANHDALTKECNELKAKHAELTETYDELKSEYDDLDTEHGDLKAKHDELTECHIGLKSEYDNLDTDYENLKVINNELIKEHDELKVDYEHSEEKCTELQTAIDIAKAAFDDID